MKTPIAIVVVVVLTVAVAVLGFGLLGEFSRPAEPGLVVSSSQVAPSASAPEPQSPAPQLPAPAPAPEPVPEPPSKPEPKGPEGKGPDGQAAKTFVVSPEAIRLGEQVRQAVRAASSSATVGLAVVDLRSNKLLASVDGDRMFRTASLVKLILAVDAMEGPSTASGERTSYDADTLARMIRLSDDAIASSMWVVRGGGAAIVRRTAARLGMTSTKPPTKPGQWGDTMTTANDMVRLYRHILLEMAPEHRDVILTAMHEAPKTAKDGFNQHFGIPSGMPSRDWGIKQGWATDPGGVDTHTSGVIDKDSRIVVLLTTHPELSAYRTVGPQSVSAGISVLNKGLPAP